VRSGAEAHSPNNADKRSLALVDDRVDTIKVCIVGASGKLGQHMMQHALAQGYDVIGVCREQSVAKLAAYKGYVTVIPGATDDRDVIGKRWQDATWSSPSWSPAASTDT
jgi:NADPH:quinone reductase-like Zn-dependent oxidoreductase